MKHCGYLDGIIVHIADNAFLFLGWFSGYDDRNEYYIYLLFIMVKFIEIV